MTTAGVIRIVLLIDIIMMALLAVIYLRQRRMDWPGYCFWGLMALALPVIGPFLVIACHPGERHPDPFPSVSLRQKVRGYYASLSSSLSLHIDQPKQPPHRRHPKRWI